jgi:hypothetical protein
LASSTQFALSEPKGGFHQPQSKGFDFYNPSEDVTKNNRTIHSPLVTSNLAPPQKLDHDCLMQSRKSAETNSGRSLQILIFQASSTSVSKLNSFAGNILRTSSLASKFYPDFAHVAVRKSFDSKDLAV